MDEERKRKLIGAIDQGTSSSRFLVFSIETGELVTYHQVEVEKIYPNEGWVEQDPVKILDSVLMCIEVVAKKLSDVGFGVEDILCVGLTNQRESTILWDSVTGMLNLFKSLRKKIFSFFWIQEKPYTTQSFGLIIGQVTW